MNLSRTLVLCGLVLAAVPATAVTVDSAHPYAYGANIGWVNAQGAAIGTHFCTGFLWSANCGWISLGYGPTNGFAYGNETTGDWGVNHDGVGHLTGHAYGANIGWIVFEQTHGRPRVDLRTGNLSGHIWGANVGWIGLSNAMAFVRTERLDPGPDTDGDAMADAWELARTNTLTALHGRPTDADGDGVPDADEYVADTDPFGVDDLLHITSLRVTADTNIVLWTSRPTRLYRVDAADAPGAAWSDAGGGLLGPAPGDLATAVVENVTNTARAYRVKAVIPLSN